MKTQTKFALTAAALMVATAGAFASETLLQADFTKINDTTALEASGWTHSGVRSSNLSFSSNVSETGTASGIVSAGWNQLSVYSSLSSGINLDEDGLYEITYNTWSSTADKGLIFVLDGGSGSFSLSLGSSYKANPGIYFGVSEASPLASSAWTTFESSGIPKDATISSSNPSAWGLTFKLQLKTSAESDDVLSVSVYDTFDSTQTFADSYEISFAGTGELTRAGFMLDGAANTASVGAVQVLSVPEPSAFGLLAGVGAIALAASRRRRAK